MTQPSPCPSDRSELLSIVEDSATDAMRAHVDGCERCRREVQELASALELVSPVAESSPSERVRREAVRYAHSQVQRPVPGWTAWRTPAAALAGVVLAVLFGGLAEARLTFSPPKMANPEPWTLVLAAVWGLGLCVHAAQRGNARGRDLGTHALVAAAAFALLLLALPIPQAVEFCTTLAFGPGQLSGNGASWAFAVMSSLYAALPAALVGRIRNVDLSSSDACGAAFVFAVLATPLLVLQAPPYPLAATLACLACGAWTGERLGARR